MAEGVGNAPTSGLSRSCFQDRCSQLVSACLPEMVRVTGVGFPSLASQMPDRNGSLREQQSTCVLLLPRWWPRANARLLLTLHPEIGCQGWTRTNTVRFNKPSCYFDTTWQWRCRQDSHLHHSV